MGSEENETMVEGVGDQFGAWRFDRNFTSHGAPVLGYCITGLAMRISPVYNHLCRVELRFCPPGRRSCELL